jgi:hypothetical protein
VIGSQAEVKNWLVKALDDLAHAHRLPKSITG